MWWRGIWVMLVALSLFTKKKKIKNTVTLPQIPITGYMVILRIIHATFTFAHIAEK